MVREIVMCYKEDRRDVEVGFSTIFGQCVHLGQQVGTAESMPLITGQQCHCSNPPSKSSEEYFRKVITIPLLDHVQSTLGSQFSVAAVVSVSLIDIVPSICCSRKVSLNDALVTYADDLPSAELFEPELCRWKQKFQDMPVEERPSSLAQATKVCDPNYFPNVRLLLQIACTLPVTSCECEWNASVLRRLHNYMRASVGTEILSSLALLHVHYNTTVDLDEAVNIIIFTTSPPLHEAIVTHQALTSDHYC